MTFLNEMNKHYQLDLDAEEGVIGGQKDNSQMDTQEKDHAEPSREKQDFVGKRAQGSNKHDDDQENDLIEIHPKDMPEIPLKTVCLTLFLFVVGIGFSIAGVSNYFASGDGIKTLTFLLFGIFLSIPGIYYGIFLIQAYRADTPEDREEILDQIPV